MLNCVDVFMTPRCRYAAAGNTLRRGFGVKSGYGPRPDTIARMRISRRASAISPFYAMEYGRRAAELIADGHDVIPVQHRRTRLRAPPEFLAAARELCDGRPLPHRRPRVARVAGGNRPVLPERFRCEVPARRVVVTSGASAALLMACAALVDPGDEVLIADPSYPCNRQFAESLAARCD